MKDGEESCGTLTHSRGDLHETCTVSSQSYVHMGGGRAHRGGVMGSRWLQREAELPVSGDVDLSRLLTPQDQLNSGR